MPGEQVSLPVRSESNRWLRWTLLPASDAPSSGSGFALGSSALSPYLTHPARWLQPTNTVECHNNRHDLHGRRGSPRPCEGWVDPDVELHGQVYVPHSRITGLPAPTREPVACRAVPSAVAVGFEPTEGKTLLALSRRALRPLDTPPSASLSRRFAPRQSGGSQRCSWKNLRSSAAPRLRPLPTTSTPRLASGSRTGPRLNLRHPTSGRKHRTPASDDSRSPRTHDAGLMSPPGCARELPTASPATRAASRSARTSACAVGSESSSRRLPAPATIRPSASRTTAPIGTSPHSAERRA